MDVNDAGNNAQISPDNNAEVTLTPPGWRRCLPWRRLALGVSSLLTVLISAALPWYRLALGVSSLLAVLTGAALPWRRLARGVASILAVLIGAALLAVLLLIIMGLPS